MSDKMNNFFTEIGHIYARTLHSEPDDNVNFRRTLDYSTQTLALQPVTQVEITKLINGLDSNKGSGLDGISAKVVKECNCSITGKAD